MKKTSAVFITGSLLFSTVFLLGSVRALAADLVIATNAEIVLPASQEQITYFYFFTVVDDGGGISMPTITNLGYTTGGVNLIDSYDTEEFWYGTFEVAVTVTSPGPGNSANDCFTITYEGESVNPCFDVTAAPAEISAIVDACVNNTNGMVRIVPTGVSCRTEEYRTQLAVPTPAPASQATTFGVPDQYRFRDR